MQAPFEMTDGRTKLAEIISQFPEASPYWNEAQNRFQFVDRLLLECLGWQHPYVEVEHHDDAGGRSDYLLGTPVRAILEAKKEASYFEDLPSSNTKALRKLKPLIEGCKNLKKAAQQVVGYCALNGAPIAIVCNGPQLILFQAMIAGQSPFDGDCYFFNGFDSYHQNFATLWRLLSPEGMLENRALKELGQHRNPRIPPKASSNIGEPLRYKYRNPLQENLRSLASILLEDLENHPDLKSDFYQYCYVQNEANNRHLLLSKNIIAARYKRSADNNVDPAQLMMRVEGRNKTTIKVDDNVKSASVGSRPIVVIGDVGVGKTSFFENLYEALDEGSKSATYFIHINLGIKATLADNIKSFVLKEIPKLIREKYNINIKESTFVEAVYKKQLEDFDQGIYGNLKSRNQTAYDNARLAFLAERINVPDEHLHESLQYLARARGKQIIVVIDNADQRSFEAQQEAFLIAQELANSRSMLVFVAVRPSTFYRSKLSGALSGYQNQILTISPPPPAEVLQKRVKFGIRVAEGQTSPGNLRDVTLKSQNIVLFFKALHRSISSNESIKIFLSNITGGNIRLIVELVAAFCGSPNVDSEKIVRIEAADGNYLIPLHEFTKHALLGDHAHYNPQSSLVAFNVYDVSQADPREHFLACLIVSYLGSPLGIKNNDGFISTELIIKEMSSIGFRIDQIRDTCRRLAVARLIESPHSHFRELEVPPETEIDTIPLRVTSIGVYHTKHWITSFSFLDAVSIDTPIFSNSEREVVFRNASSISIDDRLVRAQAFRSYLEQQWNSSEIDVSYFDFVELTKAQKMTFEDVERFLSRGLNSKRRND
jgi:GTPase SAR1 family protein